LELSQLKLALQQINLAIDDAQFLRLKNFADQVFHTNQRFNLTAYSNLETIYEKGIYDSLCFPLAQFKKNASMIDLGSGAGFPGIPLKIVYPNLKMVLLEPTLKKTQFLMDVIQQLQLQNIQAMSQRAEMLASENTFKPVDYLVARAVASLPMLLELSIPLLKVGGQALIYKGKDYLAEIALAKNALRVLGATITEVKTHRLPTDHEQRALLVIEKTMPTPSNFPRMFSQIKKTPL
jgi:16S rRNA (guanine527-N7)-methyltransferase